MLVLHPQTTTGAVIALDGSPLRELGSIPVLTHLSGHCMFKALLEDEFSSLLNVFTKFRVASDRVINYMYVQEGSIGLLKVDSLNLQISFVTACS